MFLKNANEALSYLIRDTWSVSNTWVIDTEGNSCLGRFYSTSDYSGAYSYVQISNPFTMMGNIANGSYMSPSSGRYSDLSGKFPYGVVFGDGTVAPSTDDYCLSGNAITGLVKGTNVTIASRLERGDAYEEQTCVYTISNTSAKAITIGEIALAGAYYTGTGTNSAASYRTMPFIIERTVLDSPITIEAGGIGQVTYTIRMNYPIS